MKKLLKVLVLVVLLPTVISAELSTERREEFARTAGYDDAYLTSRAEEIERTQNINDAYLTEMQEELERTGRINDAATTSRAERSSHLED